MKKNIIIIVVIFICSCSTTREVCITNMIGDYYACILGHHKTKVSYMLKIMSDSFCLNVTGQDYDIICAGELINKKDSLLLKCSEEKDIDVLLSNGYSNQREHTVKILNRNKIKLGKVVLKRKTNGSALL